ncbi:MAG: M17 family peptidase N-terminal domain-containing protein, partial [Rhodospirillales bacterium]
MKIVFSKPVLPDTGALVVGALQNRGLTPSAKLLDSKMNGELTRAIKASRFKGAKAQTLTILAPVGTKLDRAFVVGLGKAKDIKPLDMQSLGGGIYAALGSKGDKTVAVAIDALEGCKFNPAEMAAEVAYGA